MMMMIFDNTNNIYAHKDCSTSNCKQSTRHTPFTGECDVRKKTKTGRQPRNPRFVKHSLCFFSPKGIMHDDNDMQKRQIHNTATGRTTPLGTRSTGAMGRKVIAFSSKPNQPTPARVLQLLIARGRRPPGLSACLPLSSETSDRAVLPIHGPEARCHSSVRLRPRRRLSSRIERRQNPSTDPGCSP